MKKIPLALWIAGSALTHADASIESPWATQSHFSAEIAGGTATMGGSPYSITPRPEFPGQTWKNLVVSNDDKSTNSTFNVEIDTPVGYQANWNKMSAGPGRLGFAGQLNMHYTVVKPNGNRRLNFAAGVYAGVGYNGARSSSTIESTFSDTVYRNTATITLKNASATYGAIHDTVTYPNLVQNSNGTVVTQPYATNALADQANKHINMPHGKATISSGLMFSAGTRIGAMIGNVFPHLRVGWAAYQLKAHMTNQMPPFGSDSYLYANANPRAAIVEGKGLQMMSGGTGGTANMGVGQKFGDRSWLDGDGFYHNLYTTRDPMKKPIKIASKGSKWTNAITLGGGVDWAFEKMTLGFYYQAALCQRVTFDKWSKDVTAGITSSAIHFPLLKIENITNSDKRLDGSGAYSTFAADTPKMSISPVIHTLMFSAKYILNKA